MIFLATGIAVILFGIYGKVDQKTHAMIPAAEHHGVPETSTPLTSKITSLPASSPEQPHVPPGQKAATAKQADASKSKSAANHGAKNDTAVSKDPTPSTPPALSAPGSVISINQSGGITAGQVTINPGPKPFSLTDGNAEAIRVAMAKFAGRPIQISLNQPYTEEMFQFAKGLEAALMKAGMSVTFYSAMMLGACPEYPGISFQLGSNRFEELRALSQTIVVSGIQEAPIHYCSEPTWDKEKLEVRIFRRY